MMTTMTYPSDLSDEEWELIQPHVARKARKERRGRPPCVDLRAVVNAVFYVERAGCPWRYLPKEYPVWQTVYGYWAKWGDTGVWVAINDTLRREWREEQGRDADPSAGSVDSQSVKTAEKGGMSDLMVGS